MNPISFPEQTTVLAKAQPQFRTLPIAIRHHNDNPEEPLKKMTCKYELSDLEMQQIIRTRCFYISQFGTGFHPIFPQVDSPFLVCQIRYRINDDGTYNLFIPQNNAPEMILNNIH